MVYMRGDITSAERRETWERACAAYKALSSTERQRIEGRFAAADRVAESVNSGALSPFFA